MKKLLSLILSVVMMLSVCIVAFADKTTCNGECGNVPTIIVPGLFQSDYQLYENGELKVNSDGETAEKPFFMPASNDIIKLTLKKVLVPLLSAVILQKDVDNKLADALGEVAGELVMGNLMSDANGDFVKDVRTVKYNKSIGACTQEEKDYIYNQIPIYDMCNEIGEDHVYFFTYCSLGNMIDTVDELYNYIQMVKEETGHDKVNLIPISQGGSITTGLLEFYPDVVNDLHRIIYVVPAINGSSLIGELFENGMIDDDESVYKTIFPVLCDDDTGLTGSLVNLALRALPNSVINGILDGAFDGVIDTYKMKYSTLMWGLCPSENYDGAADRLLSGEEDKEIRRQTDLYHQAQLNRYTNIQRAIDSGVEVFDIVDYNTSLYPLVDSWDDVNADGIIQLDSESMGATSYGVDVELPENYVSAVNNCTDKENHDHSDPHNIVDPLTGLLPETTFYFYNANHEETSGNDVLIKLVCRLSYDDSFKNVFSYPDEFPQFNDTRIDDGITSDISEFDNFNYSVYNEDDATELKNAVDAVKAELNKTVVNETKYNEVVENFYEVRNRVVYGEINTETIGDKISGYFNNILSKTLKSISDIFYEKFGGQGYYEIFGKDK